MISETTLQRTEGSQTKVNNEELLRLLKGRFEAENRVRRGVCLLNAGQYAEAEAEFKRAADSGLVDQSLPGYLAASLLGQGKHGGAVEQFAHLVDQAAGARFPPAADRTSVATRIRHALALAAGGDRDQAIQSLREGIRLDPECAELHFQLGTLLASSEDYEEAELRFTQALNIDRDHTDALVSLALCCGVRRSPAEALAHLQRAQALSPHDARIGLLLAQAAKAVQQQGVSCRVQARLPDSDPVDDRRGIDELSRVIETDPDFVDAFLSIPVGRVDETIFAMLLKTLEAALERQPEQVELHYHCGRVLQRLGRRQDAINRNERAVQIDPTFTRPLIELARLYQQTDRRADATTRLEQAIAAGAEYADVYYLLGNLCREQGQVGRARSAYRRALLLNDRYEAASKALEALPA